MNEKRIAMNFDMLKEHTFFVLSYYDILENDDHELLITVNTDTTRIEDELDNPRIFCDGGAHALLMPNPHTVVVCDYIHPGVRRRFLENTEVLIAEITPGSKSKSISDSDEEGGPTITREYVARVVPADDVAAVAEQLLVHHSVELLSGIDDSPNVDFDLARSYEEDEPAEAFKLFKKAADAGHAEACCKTGLCYLGGTGTRLNYKKAFQYFMRADELGSTDGAAFAASCHMYGFGTKRNHAEAARLLEKVRDSSDAIALGVLSDLAQLSLSGHGAALDPARGVQLLHDAFENENAPATNVCWSLGTCYLFGYGVARDAERGIELLAAGAEEDPSCCSSLGDCYRKGLGVPQDDRKAFEYYEKGATMEHGRGFFSYGNYLIEGKVVPRDAERGLEYIHKAAEEGHELALHRLGELYEEGIFVEADMARALGYFEDAAAHGYTPSQLRLAQLYRNGDGVDPDPARADFYARMAEYGETYSGDPYAD